METGISLFFDWIPITKIEENGVSVNISSIKALINQAGVSENSHVFFVFGKTITGFFENWKVCYKNDFITLWILQYTMIFLQISVI